MKNRCAVILVILNVVFFFYSSSAFAKENLPKKKMPAPSPFISKDKVLKPKATMLTPKGKVLMDERAVKKEFNSRKILQYRAEQKTKEKAQTLKSTGTNWENGAHKDSVNAATKRSIDLKAPRGFSIYQENKSDIQSIDPKSPRR